MLAYRHHLIFTEVKSWGLSQQSRKNLMFKILCLVTIKKTGPKSINTIQQIGRQNVACFLCLRKLVIGCRMKLVEVGPLAGLIVFVRS